MYDHAKATAYTEELAKPPPPGSPHAFPLPGTERPGRSAIYRHWNFLDKPLVATLDPAVRTMHDLFECSVQAFPNQPCLGTRPWLPATQSWGSKFEFMTYKEIGDRRRNFGAGLVEVHKEIGFQKDKFGVAIWSQNRPEWQVADLGCMAQGLFSVSLYETLGPDTTEFILNHAELSCVVTSLPHIPTLLKIAPRLPKLKIIVSMDRLDQGEQKPLTKQSVLEDICAQQGIKLYSMDQVEKIGVDSGRPMRPVAPEDIYTINYTSGTTGVPKGVLLTHACTLAGNCATRISNPGNKDDVGLSYLPLAHLMERLVEHGGFAVGARFGFFRGDLEGLLDDIKTLQPTGFASVPRLFNRFNTAIRAATVEADGFKGSLSRRVIDTKMASMKLPDGKATNKHWLYDRFWTPKVKAGLGFNKVNMLASGSAPLDPKVQDFLRAAFGVRFMQGYGMTETSGVVTMQLHEDYSTGNVGPPSPCAEVCLESIPDLEYSVNDKPFPRGELLIRGPSIFSGYFKNDEENKKTMEADGWFHTGDVALFDEMGRVKIIDRKKNILKLAQGEYVAPERLENIYAANCGLLANAFVHGDGDKSSLIGIIGVNPEAFAPFASQILGQKIAQDDIAMLRHAAKDPRVKKEFLKVLDSIGVKNKFNGYERVKNILLDVEPFTVENDLLTPTLKLKRQQAVKAFRKEIDRMYAEIESKGPATVKL